jgi:hypothetical protein
MIKILDKRMTKTFVFDSIMVGEVFTDGGEVFLKISSGGMGFNFQKNLLQNFSPRQTIVGEVLNAELTISSK